MFWLNFRVSFSWHVVSFSFVDPWLRVLFMFGAIYVYVAGNVVCVIRFLCMCIFLFVSVYVLIFER